MRLKNFTVLILFVGLTLPVLAQKPSKKLNRRTNAREIQKRQAEADKKDRESFAFAPRILTAAQSEQRDDFLWQAETAHTSYQRAGNISLTSPSRYGLKKDLELQSQLAAIAFVPNLFLKKRWVDQTYKIATLHGIYSATPGLQYAQKRNYTKIVASDATIPLLLTVRNQLLVSRPFMGSTCSPNQPYLILTAGASIDLNIPLAENTMQEINHHFLANRSTAFTKHGWFGTLMLRADVQLNNLLMLEASLKYFRGSFSGNYALEQRAGIHTFIRHNLTFGAGYALSYANYQNVNRIGFLPTVDLSWYFGKKQSRKKGLFDPNMR
jgi:hypothetical protein